jgi:hypothetical protein
MSEETLYCVNHPKTPTSLRCNKCGKAICSKCAVRTPVGYRCKDCIREQQAVFYTATGLDYVIAAVVGLVGGALGAIVAGMVGLFFAFFLSPLAGVLTAEAVRFAVRRRRGRYTWLVVGAAIAVATLGAAVLTVLPYLIMLTVYKDAGIAPVGLPPVFFRLDLLLYAVLAIGAAAARLR